MIRHGPVPEGTGRPSRTESPMRQRLTIASAAVLA